MKTKLLLLLSSLLIPSIVLAQVVCGAGPDADLAACASPAPDLGPAVVIEQAGPISPAPIIDSYGQTLPRITPWSNEQLQGWHNDAASEGRERKGYQHYLSCWHSLADSKNHYGSCKANLEAHQRAIEIYRRRAASCNR